MNPLPAPLPAATDCELSTRRLFAFTPAEILRAWTDPVRLARWWGPEGFRTTHREHEPWPGGRWSFVMHGPDGRDYDNLAVFRVVDPDRIEVAHVSPPRFDLVVALVKTAAGTRIDWTQRFATPALCAALAPICIPANEQNLDRLTRELAVDRAP